MRTRTLLFSAATALSGTLHAQASTSPVSPQAAFDSFLRVAATVGKPVAALEPIWPTSLNSPSSPRRFSVTAAHTIVIDVGGEPSARDSASRVRRVLWDERVTDTLVLRRRVGEVMRQLERIAGPVERCSDPLGPPAYLFAIQSVARGWQRGVAGQPTQLVWEVGASGSYAITVTVGEFALNTDAAYACSAKFP